MRTFRVQITETVTYTREVPEDQLGRLLGVDVMGVRAADVEELWLDEIEGDLTKQTPLEKAVRIGQYADYSIPQYHIEEV